MAISQTDFWKRMGLQEADRARCIEAVKKRYNRHHVEELECQGYCSFTMLITLQRECGDIEFGHCSGCHDATTAMAEQVIFQFRPTQHALDLDTAWEARQMYPTLAPKVRALDIRLPVELRAYELERRPGTPLSRLLPQQLSPGLTLQAKQETLIADFAHVIAQSWPGTTSGKRRDSVLRSDPPPGVDQTMLAECTGKVGSCIKQKLDKLVRRLPDRWLQERANTTLETLLATDEYPVVLNHGDLIPSNILVNEETWEITGLVDWAEAELLPFGTCLYGLEHLLGFMQPSPQHSDRPVFVYYDTAAQLRQLFWTTLISARPELVGRQDDVRVMRDMGVLLWHGYAWDEGAISRVVDEVNDGEELAKLRGFLSVEDASSLDRLS